MPFLNLPDDNYLDPPEPEPEPEPYGAIINEFNELARIYMEETRLTKVGAVIIGAMFLHAMHKAGFKKDDALKVFAEIDGIAVIVREAGL